MFNNYGYDISKIFKGAENEMFELKHPYVGSEHLLLSILKSEEEFCRYLETYGLNYKSFKSELLRVVGKSTKGAQVILYTPLLKRVVDIALSDAKENSSGILTSKHLLLALLEEGEGIAIRVMIGMDIDIDDLYKNLKSESLINSHGNLQVYEIGSLLNDCVDMNDVVVGRDSEIDLLIETLLRKNKNNPLLVGKAGVGKTAIVEEFVRRVVSGNVPEILKNTKVVMLEMGALVAGTKYRGEFEERLNNIIKEVIANKDIILFIDEIHTMVNAGGAEGAINAGDILKPYLARGDIKCIGATTINEYNRYILRDKALERRFEVIDIIEPSIKETLDILYKIRVSYEKHHGLKISDKVIEKLVFLSNKYIKNRNNPDKCIDVLDSACARAKRNSYNSIMNLSLAEELNTIRSKKESSLVDGRIEDALSYRTKEIALSKKQSGLDKKRVTSLLINDVLSVIENKSNVPILEDVKSVYKRVGKELKEKIIGQDMALSKILKQFHLKLLDNKKPLSLLLIGPSGVGKTESVKVFAEALSLKNKLIRLDMSEYNLETSISKLIGTTAGYVGYNDEYVFSDVKRNPSSVILVDELEKAHPKVLNLFLQIMDEGHISDSKGEKIDFSNTFIFMTSNIKTNNAVGFNNKIKGDLEEILSKELLGRYDDIIEFSELNESSIRLYITTYLADKKISVDIDDILKTCEYKKYGLRNVKNILRHTDQMILK